MFNEIIEDKFFKLNGHGYIRSRGKADGHGNDHGDGLGYGRSDGSGYCNGSGDACDELINGFNKFGIGYSAGSGDGEGDGEDNG